MDSVRVVRVILLSACLWKMSITGSITLCSDKSSSFENGTSIPAILGQPVSVVFCVQCQRSQSISPYIKIEHSVYNTGAGYYSTLSKTEQIKGLEISMVPESNQVFLNITINNVTNRDLDYKFSVRLHTSTNVNDKIDFFFYFSPFVISKSTPSDVSTTVSTETATPPVTWTASSSTDTPPVTWTASSSTATSPVTWTASSSTATSPVTWTASSSTVTSPVMWTASSSTDMSSVKWTASSSTATSPVTSTASSSTDLSSVSFPEATVSMTPLVSTECWSNKPSQCPENWNQVDNDICLLITYISGRNLPRNICNKHSADPVKRRHLNIFRNCLTRILQAKWRWPNNYAIRLNQTHYFNVQSGEYTTSHWYFNVVCMKRLEPPTITNFSVKRFHGNKWSFVDNITEYLTINTTYADVILKCQADGFPEPDVTITNMAQKHIKSDEATRVYCNEAGVFTCTANNSVASVKTQRMIQIVSPVVLHFTVTRKPRQSEIRPGDSIKMVCSFDGCPEQVAITSTKYHIAETKNSTLTVRQQVNCSHMGTYTCLAKSQTGQVVKKSAELELKGCPVSVCHSENTSQEMTPVLGENVTFSLCLMSSEELKHLTPDPGIFVTLTRNSITGFYWTANITMYNIQQHDYRTHTVRIGNSDGSLDFRFALKPGVRIENSDGSLDSHFTLKPGGTASNKFGQTAQENKSEPNVLLLSLTPISFIIIVAVVIGVTWYRVRATRRSHSRREKVGGSDSRDEGTGEVLYANLKETSTVRFSEVKEEDQEQETGTLQSQASEVAVDLHDKDSGRIITEDGLVYITLVSANKKGNRTSQRGQRKPRQEDDDEGHVEYVTIDFEKTGKFVIPDDEENKEENLQD